jgi:hypothetical protein
MKLRHAASLALVCQALGWFLIAPPDVCPPGRVQTPCVADPSAPLNKWTQNGYFDSVDACDDRLNTIKRNFAPGVPSRAGKY